MIRPLYIICGKSGSGKDLIVTTLCKVLQRKQVMSYTTRAKRTRNENTHYFITPEEFQGFKDRGELAAYTEYNGNYYGATFAEVDASDFYILDPEGIYYFLQQYKTERPIYTIYIDADYKVREQRMELNRPNSKIENEARLTQDDAIFHPIFVNQYTDVTITNNDSDNGINAITCALLWIKSQEIVNKRNFTWWTNNEGKSIAAGFFLPKSRKWLKARKIKKCLESFCAENIRCDLFSLRDSSHLYSLVSFDLPLTEGSLYKYKSLIITLDTLVSEYLGG